MARAYTSASAASRSRGLALVAVAFLGGWGLYAVPASRAKAEAALRPLIGAPQTLRFADVAARRGQLDGQTVLYVEGGLKSSAARPTKAPTLHVALIGEDGRPVYSWNAKPAAAEIAPGGETTFRTRLLAPPETFARIEISLKD